MSLVVVVAQGIVTIQDLGRPGHMHEAVPPGGALVPELLVAANRRAGNRDDAPAIEVVGALTVRADVATIVAFSTAIESAGTPVEIAAGESVEVGAGTRVSYLAVRGGVDAPLVLGGRGTLLAAGIGKRLAKGDRIAIGSDLAKPIVVAPYSLVDDLAIRIVPGPDAFEPGALATLLSSAYRIHPNSDRVGVRLEGARLPHRAMTASRPMVIGAIEVPGDGQPIVLGPDHPTTGGYPIIAVVAAADLDAMFAVRRRWVDSVSAVRGRCTVRQTRHT